MQLEQILINIFDEYGPLLSILIENKTHDETNNIMEPMHNQSDWRKQMYAVIQSSYSKWFQSINAPEHTLEALVERLIFMHCLCHRQYHLSEPITDQADPDADDAIILINDGIVNQHNLQCMRTAYKHILQDHVTENAHHTSVQTMKHSLIFSSIARTTQVMSALRRFYLQQGKLDTYSHNHPYNNLLGLTHKQMQSICNNLDAPHFGEAIMRITETQWQALQTSHLPLDISLASQGASSPNQWIKLWEWAQEKDHNSQSINDKQTVNTRKQKTITQSAMIHLCLLAVKKSNQTGGINIDPSRCNIINRLALVLKTLANYTDESEIMHAYDHFYQTLILDQFSHSPELQKIWTTISCNIRRTLTSLAWQYGFTKSSITQATTTNLITLTHALTDLLDSACYLWSNHHVNGSKMLSIINEEMACASPSDMVAVYQTLQENVWPDLSAHQQASWSNAIKFSLTVGLFIISEGINAHRAQQTVSAESCCFSRLNQQLQTTPQLALDCYYGDINLVIHEGHCVLSGKKGLSICNESDICPSPWTVPLISIFCT